MTHSLEVWQVSSKMLAHLVGPPFSVLRDSDIETLKEARRIDVLMASLLLEHLPEELHRRIGAQQSYLDDID